MNEVGVHQVIEEYAKDIGAGPRILPFTKELQEAIFKSSYFRRFAEGKLPFQRDNAVLAFLAYLEALKSMGLSTEPHRALKMLYKLKNSRPLQGRQHEVKVGPVFGNHSSILVDGAHNADAAETLRDFVNLKLRRKPANDQSTRNGKPPITWVIAMTEGKDPRAVLKILLRPGDNIVATSFDPVDGMPWVKPMHPDMILNTAKEVCEGINGLAIPKRGAYRALCAAKYLNKYASQSAHIVLTGSLYLVGDFFREHGAAQKALEMGGRVSYIRQIDLEEDYRARQSLSATGESDKLFKRVSKAASHEATPEHDGSIEVSGLRQEIMKLEEELASTRELHSGLSSAPGVSPFEHALQKRSEDHTYIQRQRRSRSSDEADAQPQDIKFDGTSSDSDEDGLSVCNPALDDELVYMRDRYGRCNRQGSA